LGVNARHLRPSIQYREHRQSASTALYRAAGKMSVWKTRGRVAPSKTRKTRSVNALAVKVRAGNTRR
jgi:hypothetical protein